MDQMSKFKVAAVQAAPVFLDRAGSVAKAVSLIGEAAQNGAAIVALPEVFIPGYAYWNWITDPFTGSEWFRRLYLSSMIVPGPEVALLCQAARIGNIWVVIGVNERSTISTGVIYNTNLIISNEGVLVGRHRKLVPTFAEKLTWTGGDGSSLRVYDTGFAPLGTLACGENTNTLARFALLAQGEKLHVANYVAFPFTSDYDMTEAIKIRAGAHAFEGKIFNMVSCSAMSPEIVDMLATDDRAREKLTGTPNAFTGVFGPNGRLITEPLIDDEGIVYADVDLNACIEPKQFHDIIGHYNRFDIFRLTVNRAPTPVADFSPVAPNAHTWRPAFDNPDDADSEALRATDGL